MYNPKQKPKINQTINQIKNLNLTLILISLFITLPLDSYAYFHDHIQEERINYIYQCGVKHVRFADALGFV